RIGPGAAIAGIARGEREHRHEDGGQASHDVPCGDMVGSSSTTVCQQQTTRPYTRFRKWFRCNMLAADVIPPAGRCVPPRGHHRPTVGTRFETLWTICPPSVKRRTQEDA